MRKFKDPNNPDKEPMSLSEADGWFDSTDEEFDFIADLKVGESLTLASGETIERVE